MITNLHQLFLAPSANAIEALAVINQSRAKIALVVDDKSRLLGTVTDGDIRRAILKGINLEVRIDALMNKNFRFVLGNNDPESVLDMMRREVLQHIPVLNDHGQIEQLLLLQEIITPPCRTNPVVIMAGGKGKRLLPYTKDCPKPMVLVGTKPMLEIILEQCISCGFKEFYLSVNYLKDKIIDHFGNGSRWGVTINYLIEEEPLGTAGSLTLLPQELITEPFLVLNGDVLTHLKPSQLLNFHKEHQALATLCVREHELEIPFGVVQVDGVELAGFEEKPTYTHLVNAGIYVINPELLSLLQPHQYIDMPNLLKAAQNVGHRVAVFPLHEYWLDVGRPETLKQAHNTWGI